MMQRSLVATCLHDSVGWFERIAAAQWACSGKDELWVITVLWCVLLTSALFTWSFILTGTKDTWKVRKENGCYLLHLSCCRYVSTILALFCWTVTSSQCPSCTLVWKYTNRCKTFMLLVWSALRHSLFPCFAFFYFFFHYQSNLLESHSSRNCDWNGPLIFSVVNIWRGFIRIFVHYVHYDTKVSWCPFTKDLWRNRATRSISVAVAASRTCRIPDYWKVMTRVRIPL